MPIQNEYTYKIFQKMRLDFHPSVTLKDSKNNWKKIKETNNCILFNINQITILNFVKVL